MIKNYLKTAWRNMLRNKATSFINIGGLSVGMAVALLIGLWIYDELSFDRYHDNYARIAQVMQSRTYNGEVVTSSIIPMPLGKEMHTTYGNNFKHVVLSSFAWNHILATSNKQLLKPGNFMEPDAAEMFTLKMLKGTRSGLKDPSSILLCESSAKALFGHADPINKILKMDNKMSVKVTGVYEDLPQNTTLSNLAFIAAWDLYYIADPNLKKSQGDWGNSSYQLFVQLTDNADVSKVSAQIKNAKLNKVDKADAKYKPAIFLQPMSRWHLYSEFKNGVNTGGEIQYVWLFAIIGIFVLLLACINFMNLSTARSEKRAREVGVRKVVGSLRGQLILQFFVESIAIAFIAFIFSLVLEWLALPWFNQIAGKQMSILWDSPLFWLGCIGFSLFVGLAAGSYPALYLSSFNPGKVLKGAFRIGRLATIPRKVLVVVQFTVSILLIIGTAVIFRQIQFSQNRALGYNKNGLIALEMNSAEIHNHFQSFRNDLLNTGAVIDIAESGSPTTGVYNNGSGFKWNGKDPNMTDDFALIGASFQYGKTVGWELKKGRDFSSAYPSDSSSAILNEAAVKYMGLKNPVGETIDWWGRKLNVIGVVKNMVMQSPYEPVKQTIFFIDKRSGDFLNIRMNPRLSVQTALSKIRATWKLYSPSEPFDFKFADQEYQKKFADEQKIGTLSSLFSSLAIFISCLGLFGMAIFVAEQRTKEIGVRKVLGASVFNLWRMLSQDFIVLVVISLLIATPIAYYLMHSWLQHYTYHTILSWWIFAATGLGAVLITLLTVSYQTIKAALMNPVKSLKTE
jgi:putative ABC transport system permease protein